MSLRAFGPPPLAEEGDAARDSAAPSGRGFRNRVLDVVAGFHSRPLAFRLIGAVAIVLLAFTVRSQWVAFFGGTRIYVMMFPAVAVSALLGGLPAGALALVVSAFLVHLSIAPLVDLAAWSGLASFLFSGSVVVGTSALVEASERRREMAKIAIERERQLRAFIDSAPVAIAMFDVGMRYLAHSKLWTAIKKSDDNLVGRAILDVYPELPEKWKRIHQRALAGEFLAADEDSLVFPDGSTRYLRWDCRPWFKNDSTIGGILVYIDDITDRVVAGKAMFDHQRRLEAIVNTAMEGIVTIDERGVVQSMNPAATKLFGFTPAEVVGQNVKILMPDDFRDNHDASLANYLRTGEGKIVGFGRVVSGSRKSGESFPMEIAVTETRIGPNLLFVAFMRDLTQINAEKSRAEKLQCELAHVSRLTEMGQIAANLAHEVAQPLNAVSNYCQSLQLLVQKDTVARAEVVLPILGNIEEQSARATKVVRRTRDFIRKRDVEKTREDVHRLIEESLALVALGPLNPRLRMVLKLDAANTRVVVDAIQIQQVIVNLVRNAVEALQSALDPEVTVAASLLIETEVLDPCFVRVSVRDNGPGLDPVVAERLFQPFVTSRPEGMGIGLSICKSIIESHGGKIWFEPHLPGGSSFHFTLPVEKQEPGREGAS